MADVLPAALETIEAVRQQVAQLGEQLSLTSLALYDYRTTLRAAGLKLEAEQAETVAEALGQACLVLLSAEPRAERLLADLREAEQMVQLAGQRLQENKSGF